LSLINKTEYPTPEVRKILKWLAKGLEVHPQEVTVDYNLPRDERSMGSGRAWGGRGKVLIRLPRPGKCSYPKIYWPYERKQGPEHFGVECWKESLVTIGAHEFQHLRQYKTFQRYTEHDTEWAALRYLKYYREEFGTNE